MGVIGRVMQNRGGYENRSNYGSYNSRDSSSNRDNRDSNRDSFSGNTGYRIPAHKMVYDGKRMRKAITRRTVDFNASVIRGLQARSPFERNSRGLIRTVIQPHPDFLVNLTAPSFRQDDFGSSVTTKFVHASMNKVRSPVQVVRWTPEGRRILTGSSSGEFTFWNGTTFNFETILQAHDASVRSMTWSNNGNFLVSGDQIGTIKFWLPSLNNLKVISNAHKESVRNITFSPSDAKFASCSDDGLIKIWDFAEAAEERTLSGHGWDVRTIHWHPYKSLLASGSKDNLVKLWDPKSGATLSTIHGHKNNITDLKWNKNGNWLASAGKDQVIKIFDIRMMKEFLNLKGHTKEINNIAWHPIHESVFATGSGDGSIMFWSSECEKSLGSLVGAHEGLCLSLDWHPVGHILASGSLDSSVRFWIRQRPGDSCLDQYVLGKQAAEAMGIKNTETAISVAEDDEEGRDEDFMIPGVNRSNPRRSRY